MKMLISLLMTGIATAALAAAPATPPATGNGLLEKLAQGGMTEIEAGKIARDHSQTPGVQKFGDMMIKDHGAAIEKVKVLAERRKLDLPRKPSEAQQTTLSTLRAKSGIPFDEAYVASQVKSHEETVAMLKSEIANGQDAETKALAAELLPTVEAHLREAYRLAATDGNAAPTSGN